MISDRLNPVALRAYGFADAVEAQLACRRRLLKVLVLRVSGGDA